MRVAQTRLFAKTAKKLHPNQKRDLDAAVRVVVADPLVGDEKAGDLRGVRAHKFRMVEHLTLLAYRCDGGAITLLALGAHEHFYRDIKRD